MEEKRYFLEKHVWAKDVIVTLERETEKLYIFSNGTRATKNNLVGYGSNFRYEEITLEEVQKIRRSNEAEHLKYLCSENMNKATDDETFEIYEILKKYIVK